MKRNTIYAFLLTLALVFSGCGSNNIEDATGGKGTTSTSGNISTSLQSITIDKNSGNVLANVNITSTYASTVVATLSSMDITLGGCPLVSSSVSATPSTVILDANASTKDVVLSGTMTDTSCVPTSYQLTGSNAMLANGETTIEPFTTDSVVIDPSLIVDGTLSTKLTIIDPTDKQLDINTSGVQKGITLHLAQGAESISGKMIEIVTPPANGSFFISTVETNSLGNAIFVYTAPTPIVDNNMTVEFCVKDDNSTCDTANINLTTGAAVDNNDTNTTLDIGNDFVNYGMTFITADGGNTLGLDERKVYIVSLIDKDTNTLIPANQIEKITIESNKPNVLKLIDPNDTIGAAVAKLEITGKNNINVYLKASQKISGLSDIKVTINYKNQKGFDRVLSATYAITVLSGPPTALSINSAGVSYNFEEKWFEHKFLISASDKYNNAINTSPTISVSVMAGYAKDSSGNRMIYGQTSKRDLNISANITSNGQVELDSIGVSPFSDFDTDTLKGVDLSRDFVAIMGNVRTYEANGKWEIDSISSPTQLILSDLYDGENYTGVGFAVGHNYRQDLCSDEYLEYEVKVDSTDGTYKLDDEGKTFVTVKFPAAFMPGKRVGLIVNLVTENPETEKQLRGGENKFVTLHSFQGLSGLSTSIPKGTTVTVTHYGIVETGTEDTWALRNSTFSCSTTDSTGLTNITLIGRNNPDDCARPFIQYSVTAATDADGTFVLSDCQVNDEFSF